MPQTTAARIAIVRAVTSATPSALWMAATGQRSIRFNTPTPEPTPPAPPKKEDPPAPKKLELTEAELQAKIDAAVKKRDESAAEAQRKKDEETAAKSAEEDAKKRGDIDAIQKAADDKVAKAQAEAADARLDIAIRDTLADEKYRDYAACAKYIKPLVDPKLAGDKQAEAITAAIEQYVKDNPRATKGAAIPAPTRSGVPAGANVPVKQPNNGTARKPFSTLRTSY